MGEKHDYMTEDDCCACDLFDSFFKQSSTLCHKCIQGEGEWKWTGLFTHCKNATDVFLNSWDVFESTKREWGYFKHTYVRKYLKCIFKN